MWATQGSTRPREHAGGRGRERARGFTVVSTGSNGQGRVNRFRTLPRLSNFSRLWGMGAALNRLVPDPGVIRAVDGGPECDSP